MASISVAFRTYFIDVLRKLEDVKIAMQTGIVIQHFSTYADIAAL